MHRKIILLTWVSLSMLSLMVVTLVSAQPRTVGVAVGDWFKYGDIDSSWDSNVPNGTFPSPSVWEWYEEIAEREWLLLSVVAVSGTNVTGQVTMHYKNGTETVFDGFIDVDTGTDVNMTFMAISANLNENDVLYTSEDYSEYLINATVMREYPDSTRFTNHVNTTSSFNYTMPPDIEVYYSMSMNFYWDKATGILVEQSFEWVYQTEENFTEISMVTSITESNVWVIPEFPSFLIPPLFMTATLLTVIVFKRKLISGYLKSR
jgi:hypothetical protein